MASRIRWLMNHPVFMVTPRLHLWMQAAHLLCSSKKGISGKLLKYRLLKIHTGSETLGSPVQGKVRHLRRPVGPNRGR